MTITLTCEQCGRSGDVRPKVLNLGSHRVAFEETAGESDMVIQWQEWEGHWFCHTCLADYAAGDDVEAEQHYPENVQ